MHRRCTTLTLTLFTLAVAASGCVADDGGNAMFIHQNNIPSAESGSCSIESGQGSEFRGGGIIDISFQNNFYELYPVLESRIQLTETSADELQKTISLRRMEVNFTEGISGGFEAFVSGSLGPGEQATLIARVLDLSDVTGLVSGINDREVVVVELRVFGELQGGEVESDPFFYPIEVCDGCLNIDLGDCSTIEQSFTPQFTGGECNPRQDLPVQCCNEGGVEICPAVGTMVPTP